MASERSTAKLARELARLRGEVDSLSRARQIMRSDVPVVVDGETVDMPVVDVLQEAAKIPGLSEDLADAKADVDELNNTTLPALNSELAAARDDVAALHNTTLPALNSELALARDALAELDATTLPALNDELSAARDALAELDNTTLPALNDAVQEAKDAAVAAAVLRIDSSKGSVFKNNSIATTLTVTIYYATKVITNIYDLHDALGPGAFLEWFWRRDEDEAFGVISSADSRLSQAGFAFTVSPDDVDEKTIFQCVLHS